MSFFDSLLKRLCLHILQSAPACWIEKPGEANLLQSMTAKCSPCYWWVFMTFQTLKKVRLGCSTGGMALWCRVVAEWTSFWFALSKCLTTLNQSLFAILFQGWKFLWLHWGSWSTMCGTSSTRMRCVRKVRPLALQQPLQCGDLQWCESPGVCSGWIDWYIWRRKVFFSKALLPQCIPREGDSCLHWPVRQSEALAVPHRAAASKAAFKHT